MELVRIEPYRLVECTSLQRGLPPARHERHFGGDDGAFAHRIVIELEPQPGLRGVFDCLVIRRAVERTARRTVANLERRLGSARS